MREIFTQKLQTRLAQSQMPLQGDSHYPPLAQLRAAAVLIPIVCYPEQWQVILTQRTAHLHHHANQISFPGGQVDPEDTDAIATALRETHEEIGLAHTTIEVIGQLPRYCTITGFAITPVIGLITPPYQLQLDAFEVAQAFEVPLDFLLDARHYQRHAYTQANRQGHYWAVPYQDKFIWGATAGMLHHLLEYLADPTD